MQRISGRQWAALAAWYATATLLVAWKLGSVFGLIFLLSACTAAVIIRQREESRNP